MMKQLLLSGLLACMTLFLSSCFEIIEEISLRPDGSGDMTITVNLSQSKTKVASVMMMDSVNGYKVPSRQTIQREINEAVGNLKKMPGISNVKGSTDFTNYIGMIRFSFKDAASINNVTKTLLESQKIRSTSISTYSYNKASATFSREYRYYATARAEYNKLKKEDKEVFRTATYTSIWHFPKTILKQTNPLAKQSKSGMATMQRCSIMDLINGTVSVSNQVQLDK